MSAQSAWIAPEPLSQQLLLEKRLSTQETVKAASPVVVHHSLARINRQPRSLAGFWRASCRLPLSRADSGWLQKGARTLPSAPEQSFSASAAARNI